MLEQCLALRREIGNPVDIAATLSTLSLVQLHMGDTAHAREGEQEAVTLFRGAGDRIGEAIGLLHLGEIDMYVGNDDAAGEHLEQCLRLAKQAGHAEIESECERMLGELSLDAGDLEAAQTRFMRALAISRDAEDKRNEAIGLWFMGRAELASGVFGVAEERLASALAAFQSFRMHPEAIGCLEDYATLLRVRGDVEAAVALSATIECARRMLALPRRPRAMPGWEGEQLSARASLGDEAYEKAWARGSERLLEHAIEQILAPVEVDTAVTA